MDVTVGHAPGGPGSVISEADWAFWQENGYLVIREVVPPELLSGVMDAVWTFLGMNRDDPEDWYREPHRGGGMVELYQHQALWDTRQYPRIHQAFAEIWGTEQLWVSMDRANMKPPRHADHPEYDHEGFIHWDLDSTQNPIPFGVQGVLYLSDTDIDQGGFQCVPGFHRHFPEWIKTQPLDRDPRRPDLSGLEVKPIAGKAGDFLIWHRLLAHGNGRNCSDKPRLAQYISMRPAQTDDPNVRDQRVRMWRDRLSPEGKAFPGDPRRLEQEHGVTAELTSLGEKLVGVTSWN
ncbi:TPA: phytanoyl-CoA dioxygenase [Candidatus Latescibacteria bacterium]|nr:phytanoyl-CoA dioxygenase [Candidatus Latescibacterota bacterium]